MRKKLITAAVVFTAALLVSFTVCARVGEAVKTFKTPGSHPTAMTFDGKILWLADSGTGKIYGLNPKNGELVSSLEAPGYDPVVKPYSAFLKKWSVWGNKTPAHSTGPLS